MLRRRWPAISCLVAADVAVLVLARPQWHSVARQAGAIAANDSSGATDAALGAVAGAALWLVAAWLGVGFAAALLSAVPGACGRMAHVASRRLLPAAVRRLVAGSAGLSVLLGPVAGAAAQPLDPGPHRAGTVAALPTPSWPVDGRSRPPAPARVPTDPPAQPPQPVQRPQPPLPVQRPQPPHTAQPPTRPTRSGDAGAVRVRPGDSLWLIAARRLGPSAGAADIAAAWPRWYAANRALIGPDPALIHPGQVLYAPTVDGAQP